MGVSTSIGDILAWFYHYISEFKPVLVVGVGVGLAVWFVLKLVGIMEANPFEE